MTEYCEGVAAGAHTCPISAHHVGYPTGGALAGVWADGAAPAPASASADDLASEAAAAASHFGNATAAANRNAQYLIVSPTGTTPDRFNTPSGGFCAWHDYTGDPGLAAGATAAVPVAFTNLPYIPDAPADCGANFVNPGPAGALDGVTIVAGHEYAETITDQFPTGGWARPYTNSLENGDLCAWIKPGTGQGSAQDITLTTGTFAVQSTWANELGQLFGIWQGCEVSHSVITDNATSYAPAIVSYFQETVKAGRPGTFTVITSAAPLAAISETGALPPGVTLVDNHDGTATLSGNPDIADGGIFHFTLRATNGIGAPATQDFVLTVRPWSPTIINFAGDPATPGDSGDGGPAISAQLRSAASVALDGAGNVYIVDQGANRVRKVDASGIIANLAGVSGNPAPIEGNTGDGGVATSATLSGPMGVAVDRAGNIFIADTGNSRVRRIDPTGTITNFAGDAAATPGNSGDGGLAGAANLRYPMGIAVDSLGDVYIADTMNNRIRMVDSSGLIINVAGSPTGTPGNSGDSGPATAALLSHPQGIALDAAGNLFIADTGNRRVRRLDRQGTITNFAGIGDVSGCCGGDGGPAASAVLSSPTGVAADRSGTVYIADAFNDRVRAVNGTGIISTYAGGHEVGYPSEGDNGPANEAGLFQPAGLTVDSVGNLYVPELSGRVREVLPGPRFAGLSDTSFAVGAANSFQVQVSGIPTPGVTESGPLPKGVSFDRASRTLNGTPASSAIGSYPVTFKAANNVGNDAHQSFTLTVNQAALTNPVNGQANVVVPNSFSWSTVPEAQGYALMVSAHPYGAELFDSGFLDPNLGSASVPVLPAGKTLYAMLCIEIAGHWSVSQTVSFTAVVARATFFWPPSDGFEMDAAPLIVWHPVYQAVGYIVALGTKPFGVDLLKTGLLQPNASSLTAPVLPSGRPLYATIVTELPGGFVSYSTISFSVRAPMGVWSNPVDGQQSVITPADFTWFQFSKAQNYWLVVGTTPNGKDLANSGLLPSSASSYRVGALPRGKLLYATLLTMVNGKWVSQRVAFTAR